MATTLTTEIKNKIVELVDQKKSAEEISLALQISIETLQELFQKQRQERLLRKAEKDSEDMLDIDLSLPERELEKKYGKSKLGVMKLKQAESMFIRETIGKDIGYSKRNEVTGKGGEEIRIKEIIFSAPIYGKSSGEEKECQK